MSQIPDNITVDILKARNIMNKVLNRLQQDLNPPEGTKTVATDLGNCKNDIPEEAMQDILLTIMESTLTSYGINNWGDDSVANALFGEIITKTNDHSFNGGKYSGTPSKITKLSSVPGVIGIVESYVGTYSRPAVAKYFRTAFTEEGITPPSTFMFTLKNILS